MRKYVLLLAALVPILGAVSWFEPTAAPMGKRPVMTFAVLSDVHVMSGHQDSELKWENALTEIHQLLPHASRVVVNGDLGDGRSEDYHTLNQVADSVPHAPIRYTIGNHEFYKAWYGRTGELSRATFPNGETEAAAVGRFLNLSGRDKVYSHEVVDGFLFVYLGSEQSRIKRMANMDSAYLSEAQLQYLMDRLAENHPTGRPAFVFLHQPLRDTVAGSDVGSNQNAIIQEAQLRAILTHYPEAFLFTGHTHWELKHPRTLVRDGFTMINTSSVQDPYDGQDRPLPGRSEGMIVEVYPDEVRIRGREFAQRRWIAEAQFRVPLGK